MEATAIPQEAPRLLLVEDDPTSRAFMAAALVDLPARVDEADSCAQARALATGGTHALWLIDANLPDGLGADLLGELRTSAPNTLAVAHTASSEPALHGTLRTAGFTEVLVKPMSAAGLQAVVRRLLVLTASPVPDAGNDEADTPIWDDAVALSALKGESAHVNALRGLFRDELPAMHTAIHAALAAGDRKALHDVLHRLDASCGFVGATRLTRVVLALRRDPVASDAVARFDQAVRDVLAGH